MLAVGAWDNFTRMQQLLQAYFTNAGSWLGGIILLNAAVAAGLFY